MKRLALLIARLYPYAWRQRYGQELNALIEDSTPGPAVLLDTLQGALAMQIKWNGLRVAAFGVAGAIIAEASSFAIKETYRGTVVLSVSDRNEVLAASQRILSRQSLWQIIEKNQLYHEDRNRFSNEALISRIRSSIRRGGIHQWGAKPDTFHVSFEYPDRSKAKAVTDDLAQLFLKDSTYESRLID